MTQPLQHCSECNQLRAPEGGVQIRPGRWLCARCCGFFIQRKKKP